MGVPWSGTGKRAKRLSHSPAGRILKIQEQLYSRQDGVISSKQIPKAPTHIGCNDDRETLYHVQEDLWPGTLERAAARAKGLVGVVSQDVGTALRDQATIPLAQRSASAYEQPTRQAERATPPPCCLLRAPQDVEVPLSHRGMQPLKDQPPMNPIPS